MPVDRRSHRAAHRLGVAALATVGLAAATALLALPASAAPARGGTATRPTPASAPAPGRSATRVPQRVIFDTDMGGDCDDTAALALLNVAQDRGDAQLLGVLTTNPGTPWAAGTVDAIDTYYHHGNIPIGVRDRGSRGERMPNVSTYAADIAQHFPNDVGDGSSLPNNTDLYRKLLSRQPDDSVTLIVVGSQSALPNLLSSHADRYSRLSGMDLVKQKVHNLVMMGSQLPSGAEWNIELDPEAAWLTSQVWPTRMVYDGFEVGDTVHSGSRLFTETPVTNPVREAYKDYVGEGNSRSSWDVTAAYYAVYGGHGLFTTSEKGRNVIDPSDGSNAWSPDRRADARYLIKKASDAAIADALSDLFVQPPAAARR